MRNTAIGRVGVVLAVGFVIGTVVTQLLGEKELPTRVALLSRERSRSVQSATSSTQEKSPVFYVEGTGQRPTSCDDATIEQTADALYYVAGASTIRGGPGSSTKVRVMVRDRIGPTGTSHAARVVPEQLQINVSATGRSDDDNRKLEQALLSSAELTRPGDPTSLAVAWPVGFAETSRGVPWRISGNFSDTARMYRSDGPDAPMPDSELTTTAATTPTATATTPTATGASGSSGGWEELSADEVGRYRAVQVSWSSITEYGATPYRAGLWFGFAPDTDLTDNPDPANLEDSIRTGHVTRDGYLVSVTLMQKNASQADVDALAAKVAATSFMCPAERTDTTPDPSTMTRVAGGRWIAYVQPSVLPGASCPRPDALFFGDDLFSPGLGISDCSPLDTFSTQIVLGRSTQLAFVTAPSVHRMRVRLPAGEVVNTAEVVHRSGAAFGLAAVDYPRPPAVSVVLNEALDDQGTVVESAAYRIGCGYDEECSPLRRLLREPPLLLPTDAPGQIRSAYLGRVELPLTRWPDTESALGPASLATTGPQECVLLEVVAKPVTNTVAAGGGEVGAAGSAGAAGEFEETTDGFTSCVPEQDLRPDAVHVETESLDYFGATDVSLALVGSDVASVRVTANAASMTIPVQRRMPGPGAAAFDDLSEYGRYPIVCEALDASGQIIATQRVAGE